MKTKLRCAAQHFSLFGNIHWPILLIRGDSARGAVAAHAEVPKKMKSSILCSQCDQPESRCTCDRFCCYCQGQENIRLCMDGKYYCPDCREACEISVADSDVQTA